MNNKLLKYGFVVFRICVVCYAILAIFYFLKRPMGSGDEALFIRDLQFIASEGWMAALKKGISIPYMLLVYPFAQVVEAYIALRLINILLFLGLLFYFYHCRNLRSLNFYLLLLFFYSTVGYFLFGINDTLFIVAMVIFFSETYFVLMSEEKERVTLLGIALVVAVFTRELFIVFLPVVLLSFYLLFRRKQIIHKSLLLPGVVCFLFLLLNVPSLQENNTLSYDVKAPPESAQANWAQRQYYAQLLVNEGKLKNYNHPTWAETDTYLIKNGEDALPNGIVSGMLFDIGLTIKEFFKDLGYIGIFTTRQLGLVLPIMLIFGLREFFSKKKMTPHSYISVLVLSMILIFALIIISFVELRWLGSVFILAILSYSILEKEMKIPPFLSFVNYVFISCISLYGIYGFIQKLL